MEEKKEMSECYYCVHGDIDAHGVFHCELNMNINEDDCESFEFDTGEEDE